MVERDQDIRTIAQSLSINEHIVEKAITQVDSLLQSAQNLRVQERDRLIYERISKMKAAVVTPALRYVGLLVDERYNSGSSIGLATHKARQGLYAASLRIRTLRDSMPLGLFDTEIEENWSREWKESEYGFSLDPWIKG